MPNIIPEESLRANGTIDKKDACPVQSRGVGSVAESQPIMLLVLGGHRCGTSLTARMLECLGAQNSLNLIPADEYNLKGYFEDWDIYQFNEYKLLPQLGASWQSIGPIEWHRLEPATLAELHSEACDILRRNYSLDQGLRVLKEPRISRLLPFWLPVIREIGFEVKIILAVRDPLSASLSLSHRDGLSITHAAMIYLTSWGSILADTVALSIALVHYEDILASPSDALSGIVSRLSLELPAEFDTRLAEFANRHLDPALCHSKMTAAEVLADVRVPPIVARCYELLLGAVASQNLSPLAAAAESVRAALAPIDTVLSDFDRLLGSQQHALDQLKVELETNVSLERNREKLQASLQEAGQLEQSLRGQLQHEREAKVVAMREIADASARHAQALSEIRDLHKTQATLQLRIEQSEAYSEQLEKKISTLTAALDQGSTRYQAAEAQLAGRISALESQLCELYRSASWRLSAPVRWLGGLSRLRPGQVRRWKRSLEILYRHRNSGLFDAAWYLRQNPVVESASMPPLIHFAFSGVFENRSPNPYFDEKFYLSVNPDIINYPVAHYALSGFWENRACCPLFDNDFYARQEPGLAAGETNLLAHYARQGWKEGKNPHPLFSTLFYSSQSPPQDGELEEPLARYLHGGWRGGINPHPFFEVKRYLEKNPDVHASGMEPLRHFIWHGAVEGRSPCEFFDCETMFQRCPHLAVEKVNPLVYYLHHPWERDPHPEFTLAMCLERTALGIAQPFGSRAKFLPPWAVAGRPLGEVDSDNPPRSELLPKTDIRAIAIYVPRFHATPENDAWWGKGFTDWTSVRRGMPRYEGHYQPHVPHSDLGYYDLNDLSVMEKQAQLARSAGIEGFCFNYYWFDGRRLLETPIKRLLATGNPDFPFCFCWANDNWCRRRNEREEEVLIAQSHSTESDERFIEELLPAFRDPRYIRFNGLPLLVVHRPGLFPDPTATARTWRRVCKAAGLGGVHLAFLQDSDPLEAEDVGFDTAIQFPSRRANARESQEALPLYNPQSFSGMVFDYREMVVDYVTSAREGRTWPAVCPSWDDTARSGDRALSCINATPRNYRLWLSQVAADLRDRQPPDKRIVFINAWNEWAEGNHLEPDVKHGYAWLNATKEGLR